MRSCPRPERASFLLALALTASGACTSTPALDAAAPAYELPEQPAVALDPLDPAACAECHPLHAEEWRTSAHAQAFVDPLFVEEWSGDRFCSGCHAPRAGDPDREPDLAALGVDCASCHVRDGVVLSARVSGEAPHESVADPSRAGTSVCAPCHQFDFERQDVPLQNTLVEWEESGVSVACPRCHAPVRDGRTTHSFPGHRSPELLARALAVEASATRVGWHTDVRLVLRADRVGHAVPTGDVFRRLVVRAWVEGREGNAARVELGRRFSIEGGTWTPRDDERVPPPGRGSREVRLRLADRGPRVRWSVDLWSLDPRHASRFHPDVQLHTRMIEGVIELR